MSGHKFNQSYSCEYAEHIAFPMGGIGAGMICLEGSAGLSHVSIRNRPALRNEPTIFAAFTSTGSHSWSRVLEGPVPRWKLSMPGAGYGLGEYHFGLPRFKNHSFLARFPFATVDLNEQGLGLDVRVTGWSPFIPGNADDSGLPMACLEYELINTGNESVEGVFSFNSKNFLGSVDKRADVRRLGDGFCFDESAEQNKPWTRTSFAAVVLGEENTFVDCAWFRGGFFDPLMMRWRDLAAGKTMEKGPHKEPPASPGASLMVPVNVPIGKTRKVRVNLFWYSPQSDVLFPMDELCPGGENDNSILAAHERYEPWYATRFTSIDAVVDYATKHYAYLYEESARFRDCFYSMTLPPEVVEAVAANLTTLKSPTVLRQKDGRLTTWEGCGDNEGSCPGSCTHVWNYAQALPHLFPDLERSLRVAEFGENMADDGYQHFRSALPIQRRTRWDYHSASDGQFGNIIKLYRDWRICGDNEWMKSYWPGVCKSLSYCISTWDPEQKGALFEPHHNTYDVEFWGPDSMCTSFYLAALQAACEMGKALGENVSEYENLATRVKTFLESQLFNGEYFYQKVQWIGLHKTPEQDMPVAGAAYGSPEARELLRNEGPKYQVGDGCLSDGVLGEWMSHVCGLGELLDPQKVRNHLESVFRYNFKHDLSDHVNAQRPVYALGDESALLLCTWPHGSRPSLPFIYCDEAWTGVEYQVASHLIMNGNIKDGLEIVRAVRRRYDGRSRNPFSEAEAGHWYARAMSSYALLEAFSGARYDAVTKTLHIHPRVNGDFESFICTAGGYGTVGIKDGKPFIKVYSGEIPISHIDYLPLKN